MERASARRHDSSSECWRHATISIETRGCSCTGNSIECIGDAATLAQRVPSRNSAGARGFSPDAEVELTGSLGLPQQNHVLSIPSLRKMIHECEALTEFFPDVGGRMIGAAVVRACLVGVDHHVLP